MENSETKKRKFYINKKVVLLAVIALLISIIAPVSYAFFTSTLTGNENASDSVVRSGTMRLVFTDGQVIGTTSNFIPGSSITKSFTVENTGTLETSYSVFLENIVNTFVDQSDLVYTISSTTNGSNSAYSNNTQTQAPARDQKIINNVTIASGETHSYTITITFLNKNENQDDNQGKRFEGKLQVYDIHNEPDVSVFESDTIENIMLGLYEAGSNDLALDDENYEPLYGNYLRYVGESPSNYIYYNCSTTNPNEMNDSTCEKWRIIGLFDDLDVEGPRAKIIKEETLGLYSWDTYDVNSCDEDCRGGADQWGESTYFDGTPYPGADLMQELNKDYLGTVTVGTDGYWYNGFDDESTKTEPMPTSSLNQTAQSMIEEVRWDIGINEEYGSSIQEMKWYPNGGYYFQKYGDDNIDRDYSWTGKVGLMSIVDMGYATSGGNENTRQECLEGSVYSYDCNLHSWLANLNSNEEYHNTWTITAQLIYESSFNVIYGIKETLYVDSVAYVNPALYLKDNVMIVGGLGTSSSPYKLTI